MAQPQHPRIVRCNVDSVSNSHTARKLELARSDGCPFAAWCTPAQRMSADNGECTAASIRCEPSDGLVAISCVRPSPITANSPSPHVATSIIGFVTDYLPLKVVAGYQSWPRDIAAA